MTDDGRDQRIARRLRAYESRLPDADAPDPSTLGHRQPLGRQIFLVGGAVVATTALVAVLLLNRPDAPVGEPSPDAIPSASPSATVDTEPSATPSASERADTEAPSPTPGASSGPATADLTWTRTASFPGGAGLSVVDDVARIGDAFIAVGVEFSGQLPVLGPTPPHRPRVWTSNDGRAWDSVDLGTGFENVRFGALVQRADGSLVAVGWRGTVGEPGMITETEPAAWITTDGIAWEEIPSPVAASVVEQGRKGALAVVRPSPPSSVHELWLSTDGVGWERVHSLEAAYVDIGAGDEGFVAVGWIGAEDGGPFAIASADGRAWVDAPTPSFGQHLGVTAHGGDWIVVDDPGGTAPTWFSANGLDWTAHGEVPFRTIELADDTECREYRTHLMSARPWLVTTSALSYPCSEGGFVVHGTQYLSTDGAAWLPIPLTEGTVGESRSGSSVSAALPTEDGLILVGEENGSATFWFGQPAR